MGLKEIYRKLNMTPENGLCIIEENKWKGKLSKRLEYLIEEKLEPEAFFCFDRKPLILFYDSPENKQDVFKAIWNFNETPIVIINEVNTVEIFNGFSYLKNESTLDKLEDYKNLDNFSYFELITGKSIGQYHSKLKHQSRVDYFLLENISDARGILIANYGIEDSLANALIGKCIFVRYLIDRGVNINFEGQSRIWTNNEFCDLLNNKTRLLNFFKYLRTQFNGEAFLLNDDKLQAIPQKAFSVLKDLLNGTQISRGQLSLFDIYDFSIIPVEFISNVYEHFIGKENQAAKGAYYTPKFLVDYIVTETVGKYFQENTKLYKCHVLDPACGSGIFLVEALRKIVERYIELNGNISKITLKELAENHIFGIDKDENAINVAIFSIYLVLLDYQNPKDIESFTFPNLMQKGNFYIADFFDTNAEFNSNFGKIKFDFVIGNPPWKRGASQDNLFLKYITTRNGKESNKEGNESECVISNKEIAQAFLIRTSDFSSEKTKCALIVTSKTLYNLNARNFRRYLLYKYYIDRVFEFAPVRREIFDKSNDKAIAPAVILFFRYSHGKDTDSNELIHLCLKPNYLFSLLKVFVLQRTDIKKVVQKKLKRNDWLWKVLVYGSYLDFNFINRLKDDYISFSDIAERNNFTIKEGIIIGKNGTYDMEPYIGESFIKTEHLSPFYIFYDENSKWNQRFVHRDRRKNKIIFKAPALLISRGISKYYRANAAILYKDAVFTHSLTSIKTDKKNIDILRIANGVMCSNIFTYFALLLASSVGIEREQLHDKERINFPFIDNPRIAKIVKQIEQTTKQLAKEKQKPLNPRISKLETERQIVLNLLNEEIFKTFDLNEQEIALIDYAVSIRIPLIMRHIGYKQLFSSIPFRDKLLEDYLNIYFSRFENSFNGKYLEVDIWSSSSVLGVFFKVVQNSSSADKQTINWKEKSDIKLLEKVASFGFEKITDKLFIQKDIRGFEKDGFYIIKPNEKMLWHKAIAYLDVNEFMDAILKSGKDMYHE